VFARLDIVGRGGIEHLNYRNRLDLVDPIDGAGLTRGTDRLITYGVGIGYHLGRATRIGSSYDQTRRESPVASRRFARPNIGTSLTYDF